MGSSARRALSLAEVVVVVALAAGALTLVHQLWRYSDRYFRKSQLSLELQVGARTLAESVVRDVGAAHTVLAPRMTGQGGKVLRLVRYLSDEPADWTSRRAPSFLPGEAPPPALSSLALPQEAISRGFAAWLVEYDWDPRTGIVKRHETDGTWYWATDRNAREVLGVLFVPRGRARIEERARNVVGFWSELLGYDRRGRLDTIASLADEDLPYVGEGSRHGATSLVLLRIHSRVETPAGEVGATPDVDLVTKVWCGRRGLAGVAGPSLSSLSEAPASP
ncbi:MAG: hypothetical protein HY815_25885 [Candidatus Riflebacteria bacterium]|nr:hypothetical protein [Candidatus Riflebacteria bacterium]